MSAEVLTKPAVLHASRRFEYKVIHTGKRVEKELNELGAGGWKVVGVTTKKQLFRPAGGDHPHARAAVVSAGSLPQPAGRTAT